MDVPEFGELIGAQSGPHRTETATLKIDDPNSPLTRQFAGSPLTAELGGKGFVYTDEFYHFLPDGPYSRDKLHVLISIDAEKSDLKPWHVRPDKDYGMVWIKSYGKGRVFNCAHGAYADALRDARSSANDAGCDPIRSGRSARGHHTQRDVGQQIVASSLGELP